MARRLTDSSLTPTRGATESETGAEHRSGYDDGRSGHYRHRYGVSPVGRDDTLPCGQGEDAETPIVTAMMAPC
jgi:hypothetical protein